MSNYWRLRCLTCTEDSDTTWNHGDEAVKMVANNRKLICAALDALSGFDIEIDIRVHYQHLDVGWLQAHKDHDVRAADEYGKVFTVDGEFDPTASTPQAIELERTKTQAAEASIGQIGPRLRSQLPPIGRPCNQRFRRG